MSIQLGKDGSSTPFGSGIISATYTEECEVVDVSNRDNVGGSSGSPGYRAYQAGFTTKMWEIECHDADSVLTSLAQNGSGMSVMSVSEKAGVDGAVTYTITCKQLG